MKPTLIVLLGTAIAAFPAHADVLATYVPTSSTLSSPSNAPIPASTVAPLVAASVIGEISTGGTQLESGGTGPIRTALGTWAFGTGGWLFAKAQLDGSTGTASSTTDYFSFNLSTPGTATLTLDTLTFDYGVGTQNAAESGTFYYAVYVSVNGGAYNKFGSTFSTGNLSLTQNATNSFGNRSTNLSSISGADSVAFRVWISSTNSSANVGTIVRNITVNGTTTTPYDIWASGSGLTAANDDPADNPDSDGLNNRGEFALDSDPLSGTSSGKVAGNVASVGGQQVLTLTLPVRAVVGTFSGTNALSAALDGMTYTIEGGDTLGTWLLDIDEVTGPDADAVQENLPPLSGSDYVYRTFRSPGAVADNPAVFLRARVE